MPDMQELTVIEAETLADAFPARCRSPALRGGTDVMRRLHPAYRTPHFTVHVDGQVVSIPAIKSRRSEPRTWESSSGLPCLSLAFIR